MTNASRKRCPRLGIRRVRRLLVTSFQAGVPLTVVSRHLGHESIQTTVDRYGHLDRRSSRVVADVVGKALKPKKANWKQKNAASA